MLFYDSPNPAPNPRRVRIFAAEKGIELPSKEVSIPKREQKAEDFVAKNPRGQTPILELDDGTVIAESVAIMRYLEAEHLEPPLFGTTSREIAEIEMWCRRVEMILMPPVGAVWVHTHPFTAALPISCARRRRPGDSRQDAGAAPDMRTIGSRHGDACDSGSRRRGTSHRTAPSSVGFLYLNRRDGRAQVGL